MSTNQAIVSFNSGILSPKVDVRVDTEKFRAGCRRLENLIPEKYGCATKRPGFKYIDTSHGSATIVRMESFIYSASISYKIEIGEYYMRFYYADEVLVDEKSNEVIIETPYEEADIFSLQVKQIGDVMRITHPLYPPATLMRTSAVSFSLMYIPFINGPFFTRNDYIDIDNDNPITMTPSITAKDEYEQVYYEGQPVTYDFHPVYVYDDSITGTLTANDDWFLDGHVNCLFKLAHMRTIKSVTMDGTGGTTNSSAIHGKGTYNLLTRGTWTGKIVWQRRENGGDWEELFSYTSSSDAYQNVNKSYVEDSDLMEHRLYTLATDSPVDTAFRGDFSIDEPLEAGIVRVKGITSTTVARITVLSTLASTDATKRWFEGAWSDVAGYPSSITFFEDRCVYAGDTGRVEL